MSDESTLAAIFGDRVTQEYEDALLDPKYYEDLKTWSRGSYKPPASIEFPEVEPQEEPEPYWYSPPPSNLWEDVA